MARGTGCDRVPFAFQATAGVDRQPAPNAGVAVALRLGCSADVDAGCAELLVGGLVGVVTVKRGVEYHFDVAATPARVGQGGNDRGVGQFIHCHPHRTGRPADQVDHGLIPGVGFLDQPVGDRSSGAVPWYCQRANKTTAGADRRTATAAPSTRASSPAGFFMD
jgi:hypothetical protein